MSWAALVFAPSQRRSVAEAGRLTPSVAGFRDTL